MLQSSRTQWMMIKRKSCVTTLLYYVRDSMSGLSVDISRYTCPININVVSPLLSSTPFIPMQHLLGIHYGHLPHHRSRQGVRSGSVSPSSWPALPEAQASQIVTFTRSEPSAALRELIGKGRVVHILASVDATQGVEEAARRVKLETTLASSKKGLDVLVNNAGLYNSRQNGVCRARTSCRGSSTPISSDLSVSLLRSDRFSGLGLERRLSTCACRVICDTRKWTDWGGRPQLLHDWGFLMGGKAAFSPTVTRGLQNTQEGAKYAGQDILHGTSR